MALGIDVEHVVRYLHHGATGRVLWSVSVERGELAVHGFAPLRAGRPALPLDHLAGAVDSVAAEPFAHWLACNALEDDLPAGYALRFRTGSPAGREELVH